MNRSNRIAPERDDASAPSQLATTYDQLYRESPFGDQPRFYDWIVKLSKPAPDAWTLDLGSGLGGLVQALARAGHRRNVWGLDLSSEAVRRAQRSSPEVGWVRADGCHLPFAAATFDVLYNLGNLEHFLDLRAGIREMRRVLRPEGRAWILLPNLFYSGVLWRVLWGGPGPDHHQPIDRFATRGEWQQLLEAEGLIVRRSIPYHKGKRWKRLLPTAFAWHFLYEATPGEPRGEALDPLGRIIREPRSEKPSGGR